MASLKETHEIDFDEISEQSTLFAITGETGSGKSTILNAISLALYGQNYKSSINQVDLVTLGAIEGRVELTYLVRGKTYQSTWYCRLAKSNGEALKTPKILREFFEIIEGEKHAQDKVAEDILGLNFDQFCKTVILNQGEFSKFLLANFKDRKEILERFYNAEAISRLSIIAKKDLDQVLSEIKDQQLKIEGIESTQTVDPDELKKHINTYTLAKSQLAEAKKLYEILFNRLRDIFHQIGSKKNNQERLAQLEENLKSKTKGNNEFLKKFNIIKEDYQKSKIQFENEVPKLQRAASLDHQIEIYQSQLKQDLITEGSLDKNIKELQTKKFELAQKMENISQKKRDFQLAEGQTFETIQNDISVLNQIKERLQNAKYLGEQLRRLQNEQEQLEKEGKGINKKLEENQEKIKALKSETIEKETNRLNSLFEISVDYEKQQETLKKSHDQVKTREQSLLQKIKDEEKRREKIAHDLERETKELKLRKDSLELKELKKSIHLCTIKSQEENICVVCHQALDLSKLETDRSSEDFEVSSLLREIEDYQNKILKLEKDETQSKTLLERLNSELEESKAQFIEQEQLFNERFLLFKQENLTKEIIKKEIQKLEDKRNLFSELTIENKKSTEELSALRLKYKQVSVELEGLKKNLILEEEFIQNLSKNLEISPLIKLSLEIVIEVLAKMQLFSQDILQIRELRQEISSLELRIDEGSQRLLELKSSIGKAKELVRETKSKRDEITTISSPNEMATKYTNDFKTIEKSYQDASLTQKTFDIELHELEAKKRQTLEQIESISVMLEFHLDKLKENLVIEKSDDLPPHFSYDLFKKFTEDLNPKFLDTVILEAINKKVETFILDCNKRLEETQAELSKSETLLSEYLKASKRKELIELEMARLYEGKQRKEHLYQLVGRDEFRNFVLSQIEKELIEQTNRELKDLCGGRYEIIQENKASRIQPEFFIIDKLRDGQTRKVSTLSGGETFMVSLATALALAELSRGNAEIDSFFIDEGFGTLDEESLEDVIEMLQNIQGMGKQIGVISHVKKLTNRIPINIHLEKNHFGNSKIAIQFN